MQSAGVGLLKKKVNLNNKAKGDDLQLENWRWGKKRGKKMGREGGG